MALAVITSTIYYIFISGQVANSGNTSLTQFNEQTYYRTLNRRRLGYFINSLDIFTNYAFDNNSNKYYGT